MLAGWATFVVLLLTIGAWSASGPWAASVVPLIVTGFAVPIGGMASDDDPVLARAIWAASAVCGWLFTLALMVAVLS